jgi:ATP-dependent RNA helicase DDX27
LRENLLFFGTLTVINMHMPDSYEPYVHRVGRTARAGKVGRSISLVGEQERKVLKEIFKQNNSDKLKMRVIASGMLVALIIMLKIFRGHFCLQ